MRARMRRLCDALMVSSPAIADHLGAIERAAREAQGDRTERIWWHFHYLDENGMPAGDMYISLSPGELRTDRPDDGTPVVEGPEPVDPHRLRRALAELLATGSFTPTDEPLVQRARHVLRLVTPAAVREEVAAFRATYEQLHASGMPIQELEMKLIEWYADRRLPGISFNSEFAYLAIAHRSGVRIVAEDGGPGDPEAILHTYIRAAADEHPEIIEQATALANVQFTWGRERMREAMQAMTLRRFYELIYFASHHFLICVLVSRHLEARQATAQLEFQPFVAEEGWAGLQPAIVWNLPDEKTDHEELLLDLLTDEGDAAAQRYAEFLTSATNPLYPRPVVELWLARAMVHTGGERAAKALPMLQNLERTFAVSGDYEEPEYFRLMTGLIGAYKTVGDVDAARRAAARLMGVTIVRDALRGA